MFESVDDVALVDVMGEASRDESTAIAERLAAVGELYVRRAKEWSERELWCADPVAAVAAEVSAAQNISRGRATGQINTALSLRERLPRVAKVFGRGTIDIRMVMTIISRTRNVDDGMMPELDAAIARHAEKWMKLSKNKLRDRIDLWVTKFDPDGVRVPPDVDDNRYVEVDETSVGMAGIWGNVHAEDGAAFDKCLDELAATVCPNDPRTKEQRRADAVGPLARREASLPCQCGSDDCSAATSRTAATTAVIHVLAERATVEGTSDTPGYLEGFGILPAQSVRNIAKSAKLKPMTVPSGDARGEGYRPSARAAEFLRWRDLTCLWPGCDAPAMKSDVDHTVAWPHGPTHPSNTKHYCRLHHMIKTFYTGSNGWSDRQQDDGTVVLTSPTGHVYVTESPGGALFPALKESTGELDLPPPPADAPDTDRGAMMPRRRQTRQKDRQGRIAAERRKRADLRAEACRQRQAMAKAIAIAEPPPF